jgi:lipopolysaccharide/colanic/teichoic acid biosynthesis glycosyltransferase
MEMEIERPTKMCPFREMRERRDKREGEREKERDEHAKQQFEHVSRFKGVSGARKKDKREPFLARLGRCFRSSHLSEAKPDKRQT